MKCDCEAIEKRAAEFRKRQLEKERQRLLSVARNKRCAWEVVQRPRTKSHRCPGMQPHYGSFRINSTHESRGQAVC